MGEQVGTLTRVGFAALKGSRHLARPEVVLDELGPVGDREWCLVDPGRRTVLRTVSHPMMALSFEADGDHVTLGLPDGRTTSGPVWPDAEPMEVDYWGRPALVTAYDGEPARLLAEMVGRSARLARARRGDVVYGDSVSLVGTASLRDLAERMGRDEPAREPERFRSTLVVKTDEPWVEDAWVGHELAVGEAVIRVSGRIGRCGVPNLHPETGKSDTPTLKALAGFRPTNGAGEPLLAVYAGVVRPGTVRPGDPVRLE